MLTLPIKKKWFEMIRSGEKKEEYREIKPYYTSRFDTAFCKPYRGAVSYCDNLQRFLSSELSKHHTAEICFRNGYSTNSLSFIAKVSLSIGTGKEEWGAEPGKEYYVLKILEVKM